MDNGASSYRRYLDGDKNAFDDIMKELFFPLVYFVNGYVRNVHTAEDIAMECFSQLVVHPSRYNFKVSLKTYLFMLGKSRAIDHLRHNSALEFSSLSDNENVPGIVAELEETVLQNERKKALGKAIRMLSDDMRAAVDLIYFEGMTYEEAAKVMKKSRKQIDNLLYRAKKELGAILKEKGDLL